MTLEKFLEAARGSRKITTLSNDREIGAKAYLQAFAETVAENDKASVELQRALAWMYLTQVGILSGSANTEYLIGAEIARTVVANLQ